MNEMLRALYPSELDALDRAHREARENRRAEGRRLTVTRAIDATVGVILEGEILPPGTDDEGSLRLAGGRGGILAGDLRRRRPCRTANEPSGC